MYVCRFVYVCMYDINLTFSTVNMQLFLLVGSIIKCTLLNSSLLHSLLHYAPYNRCVSMTDTSLLTSVGIMFLARVSVGVHLEASQTRVVCVGHATSHVRLVPVLARTVAWHVPLHICLWQIWLSASSSALRDITKVRTLLVLLLLFVLSFSDLLNWVKKSI